jgi:hypothetical protein
VLYQSPVQVERKQNGENAVTETIGPPEGNGALDAPKPRRVMP